MRAAYNPQLQAQLQEEYGDQTHGLMGLLGNLAGGVSDIVGGLGKWDFGRRERGRRREEISGALTRNDARHRRSAPRAATGSALTRPLEL